MEGQLEAVLNFSFPLNIFVELFNPQVAWGSLERAELELETS